MNKKITTALVAAITTFGVYAQAPAPCQGHEKHECAKKHENMTPQQRAEMRTAKMTKDLNLTEEQQKKISKMNLANAKKHEAKKKKMEKAHAKAKEKMMKEMAKNDKQLKKILTEEQYNKLLQQREAKCKEHMMKHKKHHKPHQMHGEKGKGHRHHHHGFKPAPVEK